MATLQMAKFAEAENGEVGFEDGNRKVYQEENY